MGPETELYVFDTFMYDKGNIAVGWERMVNSTGGDELTRY